MVGQVPIIGALDDRLLRHLHHLLILVILQLKILPLPLILLHQSKLPVRHLIREQESLQFLKDPSIRLAHLLLTLQISINHAVNLPLIRHDTEDEVVLFQDGVRCQGLVLLDLLCILDHFFERFVENVVVGEPIGGFVVDVALVLAETRLIL